MEQKSHGSPSFINIAVLLLFAVVIAVASTATTFYFLNSKTNEQSPIIQPPVIPPVQTNVIPTIPLTSQTKTVVDETANWKNHTNSDYGFSFKYPQTWNVEDELGIDDCCLNIFSSLENPYKNDAYLKPDVMKAQLQFQNNVSIINKETYIDKIVKDTEKESKDGSPVSPIVRNSIVSIPNESNLDIFKFTRVSGDIGYAIPKKPDFSKVIYVIVWHSNPLLETVFSTFKFTQ